MASSNPQFTHFYSRIVIKEVVKENDKKDDFSRVSKEIGNVIYDSIKNYYSKNNVFPD